MSTTKSSKVKTFTQLIESEKSNNFHDEPEEELILLEDHPVTSPQPHAEFCLFDALCVTVSSGTRTEEHKTMIETETEQKEQIQQNNEKKKELNEVFAQVCVKELRRSFSEPSSKFDKMQRKVVERSESYSCESKKICTICTKEVFLVELVKAERVMYHRSCFRCSVEECRRQLGPDTYSSHGGQLYCKPHHRQALMPKPVQEQEQITIENSKEGITKSSEPVQEQELELDLRSKFELFEGLNKKDDLLEKEERVVKRSPSVLSKLLKYEGNNRGIESSELTLGSLGQESEEDDDEVIVVKIKSEEEIVKELVQHKNLEEIRGNWERGGGVSGAEEMEEKKRVELMRFRSRLCQGKSLTLKEKYEKGLKDEATDDEKESKESKKELESLRLEKAKELKQLFEKGFQEHFEKREIELFENDLKKSRGVFEGLTHDGEVKTKAPQRPMSPSKLQFFLNNNKEDEENEEKKMDPDLRKSKTTSKMLSKFKQMEQNLKNQNLKDNKGLKEFTPPRDDGHVGRSMNFGGSSDEEEDDHDDKEDLLKVVGSLARAQSLKAKFEKWENNGDVMDDEDDAGGILYEKAVKKKREIRRFVEEDSEIMSNPEICDFCEKRVYVMEKVEANGKAYHKLCFRCSVCKGVLRMDSFTFHHAQLYCKNHFKQLFKIKGNYDEGFGFETQKQIFERNKKLEK